jgi:hypothetical protein
MPYIFLLIYQYLLQDPNNQWSSCLVTASTSLEQLEDTYGGVLNESNSHCGLVVIKKDHEWLCERLLVVVNLVHSICIRVSMEFFVQMHTYAKKHVGYDKDATDAHQALNRSSLHSHLNSTFIDDTHFANFVQSNEPHFHKPECRNKRKCQNHQCTIMKDAILGLNKEMRTAVAYMAVAHFLAWMSLRKDSKWKLEFLSPLDWRVDTIPIPASVWNKKGDANFYKPVLSPSGFEDRIVYPSDFEREDFLPDPEDAKPIENSLSTIPVSGKAYLYILPEGDYAFQTRTSSKPKTVIAISLAAKWHLVTAQQCTQVHTQHIRNDEHTLLE